MAVVVLVVIVVQVPGVLAAGLVQVVIDAPGVQAGPVTRRTGALVQLDKAVILHGQ
jgi:hypothetical protein